MTGTMAALIGLATILTVLTFVWVLSLRLQDASVGILIGARLATALGVAVKPAAYSWRQVAGTGALAGIGFTMSLFIAGQALTGPDFDAAKVAVFLASMIAGALGIAILWKRASTDGQQALPEEIDSRAAELGTPVGTMTSLGVREH